MSIHVEHLTKTFNGHVAVDNVSLTVSKGEFVTLLGPSGSGKSTILRCIAGLEAPTSGLISIEGEDVTHVPIQERRIGFVFQHYALFRHMSVLDNVAFGLKVRGVSKKEREEKAKELLTLVGLHGLHQRMPTQLSGGQRQRVALARALAPEPRLLLLDEPFGALDSNLRKGLRSWLRKLHDRIGLTSLMVTHDQDEAFELSDRILVMNRSRIEQDAAPQMLFDRPATEFVASFVGETNRIKGTVWNRQVHWGALTFGPYDLPDGTGTTIVFRPNDVYVSSKQEEGQVPAVIRSVQYLGATEALEIAVGEKNTVIAHVPKGVAAQSGFAQGQNIFVQVTASHVYFSLGSV